MSGGVDAGGTWAFRFAADRLFRCFAVASGHCWLWVDGASEPVLLRAGDFVALPHEPAFCFASDPAVAPVDILSVITAPLKGEIFRWQGGGDCLVLSGLFTFAGEDARVLLEALPPLVHLQNEADRQAMRWYLERMMTTLRDPQPGHVLIAEHLAQLMLIEILRLHVRDRGAAGVGWLSALADQQLRVALAAMHQEPGRRWTLESLATGAGMSRSAFALRFKQKVGTSAMEYLGRWRMLLAADRLLHSTDPVSTIAFSLGYESESAFGFAFKRTMGLSPRQYCAARKGTASG